MERRGESYQYFEDHHRRRARAEHCEPGRSGPLDHLGGHEIDHSVTDMAEKTQMRRQTSNSGFTLLEMLISTAVMLIITGSVFGVLSFSQKIYGSQQCQADMHSGMRGVIELMTQEIGQAGSLAIAPKQVAAPGILAPAAIAQPMNVTSTAGMFVNAWLTVGFG